MSLSYKMSDFQTVDTFDDVGAKKVSILEMSLSFQIKTEKKSLENLFIFTPPIGRNALKITAYYFCRMESI